MIRILLAEDMVILRRALSMILQLESDITVVAEVGSGDEIVAAAQRSNPDVAVIDVDLPGIDGITAAAALHEKLPDCAVLILTVMARPGTLQRAMAAHVSGFVLKDSAPSQLADAIRAVSAGKRVIDPDLAVTALSRANPLTPRETDVLRIAAEGATVAGIAARLSLSPGTVGNYLTSATMKLNARSRVDAIRIAEQNGWL
ncbi:response regulator transcription factor [Rugosimonospora africana]|nr:response regulator transcription factor [Rugosimonospora africana]